MTKVALKSIGFVEQNEIDDQWVQQELPAQRGVGNTIMAGLHSFGNIDQSAATLEENFEDDENGQHYEAMLDFTVRTEADISMAKKYAGRPVVVHVQAVDGNKYTIGTKQYPVRMKTQNRYDGMNTREIGVSASYKSLTSVMK